MKPPRPPDIGGTEPDIPPSADRIGRPAKRVQLRRTREWRLPPGTQVCSRPRKYGNPIVVRDNPALAAAAFETALDMRRYATLPTDHVMWSYPSDADIIADLRGLDLACWCRLDAPCHVDTLLRVANA